MAKKEKDTKKSKKLEEVKSEKVVEKKEKVKKDKKNKSRDSFNEEVLHIVIVASITIIIFCVFYWITFLITEKDKKKDVDDSETEVSISYDRIILGRSFSMGTGDYYVLYYDMTDEEVYSTYASLVTTYKGKADELLIPLYVVNMGDAINKAYVSDAGNKEAKEASELKINGPTLIKFNNGAIVDYVEGEEKITDYLK